MIDYNTFPSSVAILDADSNGGNDIEIVAAVSGKRIVVDTIMISVSADTTFFFESGSTVIFPTTNVAAKSSFIIYEPRCATAAGVALTLTATITGTISCFVRYHLEG